MKENEPVFKGVWIPAEVWESDLTPLEKLLWATVDSISDEKKPCWAGSDWFAKRLQTTPGTIRVLLTRLRQSGWIMDCKTESKNGRALLAITPSKVLTGVNGVLTGVNGVLTGVNADTASHTVQENKVENKVENCDAAPPAQKIAVEFDPVQEGLAQWIQAFGDFNPTPYFAGSAKQRKADYAAIKLLVEAGRTPEQIGETARKMFEVASKAVNGKVAWWSTRCKTPTHYVAHQNEIIGELGLINGSTSGTSTARPASDDKFLKRWTREQGPVREQFRDDSSFRAYSQAWQQWAEGKA